MSDLVLSAEFGRNVFREMAVRRTRGEFLETGFDMDDTQNTAANRTEEQFRDAGFVLEDLFRIIDGLDRFSPAMRLKLGTPETPWHLTAAYTGEKSLDQNQPYHEITGIYRELGESSGLNISACAGSSQHYGIIKRTKSGNELRIYLTALVTLTPEAPRLKKPF